ncbi:phosphoadenylyl-sulfate reductase [Marinigracilibium pacificum]|uniref:Adenosine 5'-phosphosulfate reductase n=1 Tax=Marinigracilibium pacificum TaxID=2729599 RepID=A0A848J236_9BACT|nr:phosphoadenylyl-sulfate reductase [Marinigracilibium pacificum]NMM50647.1 phosphoadenylyl-sulfate reductase [Marinigracilibium pacificum]
MVENSLKEVENNSPLSAEYVSFLNESFHRLHPEERIREIFNIFKKEDILVTTSFGSSSVLLLSMLSKVQPDHPVFFIDTGFHFDETYEYQQLVEERFGLNLKVIRPDESKHQFTKNNKTWIANPDLCCLINKVDPLEKVKQDHKIWISGLMAYQNANRADMKIFETKNNLVKFHPFLDLEKEDVSLYKFIYQLPENRLTHKGYSSIGCTHCTKQGSGREGRWAGTNKTECGIHG